MSALICVVCKKHATFEHTVFRGPSPVKVSLCPDCTTSTGAENHLSTIKNASDKGAKHAAVEAFLKAVGR